MKRLSDELIVIGGGTPCTPIEHKNKEIWWMGKDFFTHKNKVKFRPDYLFEIHGQDIFERRPIYYDQLLKTDIPIICQHGGFGFQNPIVYPLNEIILKFSSKYFTQTLSYIIALALFLGYKKLWFYGFNMMIFHDWILRQSAEYWFGRVQQAGVEVHLEPTSDLLKCKLYGYEANNELSMQFSDARQKLINKAYDSNSLEEIKSIIKLLEENRIEFTKEMLDKYDYKNYKIIKKEEREDI